MVRKILWTSWVVAAWCFQTIAIPRKENTITVKVLLRSSVCHPGLARVSFTRSTFLHGDVLRWVERLIRPCLRKLVGRWVGPNSSANTHSKIILTIPVSARGYQTGDEAGYSSGFEFRPREIKAQPKTKNELLVVFQL